MKFDIFSRLLKVTGLDTLNAFPYVKAALMGQAHRPDRTRGSNFRRGYNQCSRYYYKFGIAKEHKLV